MRVYSPSEIAGLLNVKESTLRKYCLLLEEFGYTFQRNNQNQRWYNDKDVLALKKLVTLKNNSDMSLKDCAETVYMQTIGTDITPAQTENETAHNDMTADIKELKSMIHKQNELIGELTKRLDQQQSYIDDRLNKHDDLLMQSLRESMETRKLIAAAEEDPAQQKGFFSRLFKK